MSSRPPTNPADHPYGPARWRRRRGRLKVEAIKVKTAREVETTYLGHGHIAQPPGNLPERRYGVHRPRRQRGRIKIAPVKAKIKRISDKTAQEHETTYLGRAQATQPRGYSSVRAYGVIGPKRRRCRVKTESTNVSRARVSGRTYLGRVNTIRPMWRPIKGIKRLEELTSEYRIQGESWRDVEDHG